MAEAVAYVDVTVSDDVTLGETETESDPLGVTGYCLLSKAEGSGIGSERTKLAGRVSFCCPFKTIVGVGNGRVRVTTLVTLLRTVTTGKSVSSTVSGID